MGYKRILSSDFFCFYFSVFIFVRNKNVFMAKKEEYKIFKFLDIL